MGHRGSGKDTAALPLIEAGWTRFAYADLLYNEVATAFHTTVEHLRVRETKETKQRGLALDGCRDAGFVAMMLLLDGVEHADEVLTQCRSPRYLLQRWGTEYRRQGFGTQYWLASARTILDAAPDTNFVVTDVRFPEEAALITERGGVLARVIRPGYHVGNDSALAHVSEQAVAATPAEFTFVNSDGPQGLTALRLAVRHVFL